MGRGFRSIESNLETVGVYTIYTINTINTIYTIYLYVSQRGKMKQLGIGKAFV